MIVAPPPVATPQVSPAPVRNWRRALAQNMPSLLAFAILLGLTVLYIGLFSRQLHALPGIFEWTSVVNTAVPTVLVAVGQTIVVITRGIDLSVGGVIDVSNSLAATQMHSSLASMAGWTVLILGFGALCGAVNGALIAYARLQPILVTLATLAILQGIALRILPEPGGAIPESFSSVLASSTGPWSLCFVAAVVVLWLILRRVTVGVRIFAVGNDEYAARAHGIPVRQVKVIAYALAGLLSAASGIFLAASTTAGDPAAGDVYILTSIAAVVLGGISFYGGTGSALGSIAGAFILTILTNVLFFAGIDPLYQAFFQGLFLFVAVLLGSLLGRIVQVRA
ncbi:MAG: ribose transport system permease protein [Gaiellaceae bacterium]|nr:ribose transport system permease protein [Gaiellaceae bacterium]